MGLIFGCNNGECCVGKKRKDTYYGLHTQGGNCKYSILFFKIIQNTPETLNA